MQVCDWCRTEYLGSDQSSFCSDDCKSRLDKFLLQTNCDWCYEPIQNRVGDKYCSLKCKENDLKYLKLNAKRKALIPILSLFGGAALALFQHIARNLSDPFRLNYYNYQYNGFEYVIFVAMWCFWAFWLNSLAKQYLSIDRRLHSEGLRKYFGYPCMYVNIEAQYFTDDSRAYTRTYVTGHCCPGCKYESIESQELSVRQWWPFVILMLVGPLIFVFGAILEPLIVLTLTPNSYKFQLFTCGIVSAALALFIVFFIFIKLYRQSYDVHHDRHGMTYDEKNVLTTACEIIRDFARSLPTENQIQLKESVFSKSKSMLIAEAKSIVVSYYDNIKDKETLCRSMQEEFQNSVSFLIVNVVRQKSRDYELELKIVNQSKVNFDCCTISVSDIDTTKYVRGIPPGETTVKIRNIKTSRVKISNPKLSSFLHEANNSQVQIHVDSILKRNYDDFLKLIGHERQIPA